MEDRGGAGAAKGSRRSNPATYIGVLEPIRRAFAKAGGVKPALFSANSEGACPVCNGAGVIETELGFMDTVTFGGRNIAEVLAMAVDEALELFASPESKVPAAAAILRRLHDAGH